jgi:F-box and leucine-rich repeat protein 10/11
MIIGKKKHNVMDYLVQLSSHFPSREKFIEMIDVKSLSVKQDKFNFNDLMLYFGEKQHEEIFNQISLEVSLFSLRNAINTPLFVQHLDLIDHAWCIENKPHIQCYLLTSVKNCYTDFHINMNGSAVWYHVINGRKVFCLIEPTETNFKAYAFWMKEKNKNTDSFLDGCPASTISFAIVGTGDTLIIPSGYIHAVFTDKDTIAFGGNFFEIHDMTIHLQTTEMEDTLKIHKKTRCPMFAEFCLFVLAFLIDIKNRELTICHKGGVEYILKYCQKWTTVTNKKNYYYVRPLVKKHYAEVKAQSI